MCCISKNRSHKRTVKDLKQTDYKNHCKILKGDLSENNLIIIIIIIKRFFIEKTKFSRNEKIDGHANYV